MFEDQKQTPAPPPTGGALSSPSTSRAAILEVPKSAARPASPALTVHIMPKEYYGVAPKTPVKKPVALPTPKPVPPPPLPKSEKLPVSPIQTKKRRVPIVLLIGVLFVIVIALGGYLFLRSIRQPAPPQPVTTSTPKPEPTPQPVLQPPPPAPEPEPVRPGIDTDSDGLTDAEERTIYGSDPRNPDTDGDSFIDGNEVFHLYDPLRGEDGKLEDIASIQKLLSDIPPAYHFLAPASWTAQPSGDVSFGAVAAPSGEYVEIWIHMPLEGQTFASQFDSFAAWVALPQASGGPENPAAGGAAFTTKQGLSAWRSADGLTVYLDRSAEDRVYELHYNLGEVKRNIDFLRTFEAAVNSFTYD